MSGPFALGTAWVIFVLLHPGRGLTDHINVPVGKEEPERISMLASEESPSAEAVTTTVEDGSSAWMVASSPATASLAARSGETPQRTLCRKRPSLPTARNVRVSPTSIVAFVGTTESAGASCAKTSPVQLTLNARSARTATLVFLHICLRASYFNVFRLLLTGKPEKLPWGADFPVDSSHSRTSL